LTSRYSANWTESNPANLFGNIAANITPGTEHDQNFVLDYTRTQSPTTILNARASIMRVSSIRDPLSTGFDSSSPDTLGLSPIFQTSASSSSRASQQAGTLRWAQAAGPSFTAARSSVFLTAV
jgi:hypothetical protein